MRLTGTLLQTEHYSGTFRDREDGREVAYSGTRLHVLDGVEVVRVKIPRDVPVPDLEAGDAVDLRVTVAANSGARGAYLSTSLVGIWSDVSSLAA